MFLFNGFRRFLENLEDFIDDEMLPFFLGIFIVDIIVTDIIRSTL